jgi:hypothetical protein
LEFTPFAVDPYEYPGTRLIDLVSDDRGGVFLLRLRSSGEPELLEMLVHRRDAQGLPTGGWPAEGRVIGWQPIYYDRQPDKDIWPTVHSDGREGVVVGSSLDRRDAPSIFVLTSLSADGTRSDLVEGELDVSDALIETGTVSDPPISYMADSNPSTGFLPPWGYPRDAYVRLQHSPAALGWSAWSEWHSGGWNQWFGDIALASDGERGVVLFWSRMRDEVGLFARHFTPDDATLGREVGRPAFGLRRVRFVPERGVCAFVDLPPRASARLEVFDVSGRRVASGAVDGSGLLEAVVPGTSGLSSGMYFLKLSREGQAQRARVVVAR